MLKQPTQDFPYISIFKTQSGEEFIASVVEETMMAYTVKNPLCMLATEKGFQFAPFLLMADPEKPTMIPKPIIVSVPQVKLAEQYQSAISPIARV